MHICPFCNKEIENKSFSAHKNHCVLNPNYRNIIEKQKETLKKTRLQKKEELQKSLYYTEEKEHKKICKWCNKEYVIHCTDYIYEHKKISDFCSKTCASKYSSSFKNKQKEKICEICGKTMILPITSPKVICDDCKKIQVLNTNNFKNYNKYNIRYCYYLKNECLLDDNKECFFRNIGFCNTHKGIKQKFDTLVKYINFNKKYIGDYQNLIKEYFNKKDEIQKLIDNGKSMVDICIQYTGSPKKGNTIFKLLNIQTRNLSESIQNAINQHKIINQSAVKKYKIEWHTTWDNKKFFLRSSYETNYANELDKKQILYEVESLRIYYFDSQKHKKRIAIPDFYLPETNTIVEIKSNYTLDEQNMKDKFKAYKDLGYNTKLICDYKEIEI